MEKALASVQPSLPVATPEQVAHKGTFAADHLEGRGRLIGRGREGINP
jgi:hypothetical protein